MFSSANNNQIVVSDVDAGAWQLEATLTATHGAVNLGSLSGITITSGSDGSPTVTFTGQLADINQALEGMSFNPDLNYNGPASITVVLDDLGHFPAPAQIHSTTLPLLVKAVNDAPDIAVTGSLTTDEDTPLNFSVASGNQIIVSDLDAGTGEAQVTLTATHGTLTLGSLSGIVITGGSDGSSEVSFTGQLAGINQALEGMSFNPDSDYNGSADISIAIDDRGNYPLPAQIFATSATVTIVPVNDPPEAGVPEGQSTGVGTELVFSQDTGNPITVSDPDAGNQEIRVGGLYANNGTLTLHQTTGLTFLPTGPVASGDQYIRFTGTVADINAALDGLTFAPNAGYIGWAEVFIGINDLGTGGKGGPQADWAKVDIAVGTDLESLPVNNAPLNNVPGPQTTDEDVSLVFSTTGMNPISIDDPDSGDAVVGVKLVASNGALTLSTTTNLTLIDGDATEDPMLFFAGTTSDINEALEGLIFKPVANYYGEAGIWVFTIDYGNQGTGGPYSDLDWIGVAINPVNDPPVVDITVAPGTGYVDGPLVFSAVSENRIVLSDVDAGNGQLEATVSATHGVVTLGSLTGITVTSGSNGTSTITFIGQLAEINQALDGMIYNPDLNFSGRASVTVVVDDQGNYPAPAQVGSNTLQLVVNTAGNHVPEVESQIADVIVDEDAAPTLINLGNAFHDYEDGDNLSYQVVGNTNPGLFSSVMIDPTSHVLTLNYSTDQNGMADITVQAEDTGSLAATQHFRVTVNPVNDAPVESPEIPDVTITAGDSLGPIDLTAHFVDVDSDAMSFTYSEDGGQFSPVTDATSFSLTYGDEDVHSIVVRADDGHGGQTDAVFTVTVNPPANTPPVVTEDGIPDLELDEDSPAAVISLHAFFQDAEDAPQELTYAVVGNTNPGLFEAIDISDQENFTINLKQNANGVSQITVRATDSGGLWVEDTFEVNVIPINDAPDIDAPLSASVQWNGVLEFSSDNGNQISISDADVSEGNGTVTVRLISTWGKMWLSETDGLTFHRGDGSGDPVMVFSGSLENVNDALEGLTFKPNPLSWLIGKAGITIMVNDRGNTGDGGAEWDVEHVSIDVEGLRWWWRC